MSERFIKYVSSMLLATMIFTGCTIDSKTIATNQSTDIIVTEETTNEAESTISNYLTANSHQLSNDDDDFSGLDTIDFTGKKIIFTAEEHGTKTNNLLKMKFIKYLKNELDFDYLLTELPISFAHYINEYLSTGDESILEEIYIPLEGTYAWNRQSYNDWIELYNINAQLPDDRKIVVVGVDLEHQPYTAFRFLTDILPKSEPPSQIKDVLDELYSTLNGLEKDCYLTTESLQTAQKVISSINEYESIYKDYLGEDYIEFKLVNQNILNIAQARENETSMTWNQTRDKMIYENFKIIENNLSDGIFYGQWGLNHTFQNKERHVMWFAGYLNEPSSKYNGRVLSIAYNYVDSYRIEKKDNLKYSTVDLKLQFPFIYNEYITDNDLTLIQLDASTPTRPYIEMHEVNSGIPLGLDVTNFFQYVILIRNSDAVDPLEL